MDTNESLTPEQEVAPHAEVTLQQDAKCNAEQDGNNVRATTEATAEGAAFTQGAERIETREDKSSHSGQLASQKDGEQTPSSLADNRVSVMSENTENVTNACADDRALLGPIVENRCPIGFVENIKGPGSVECSEYYPTRDAVGLLASMRQLHEYAAIHGEPELEQQLGERIAALRQMYSDEAWEASERNVQELEIRNRAEVAEKQEATSEDDRDFLGPWVGSGMVVGFVDEVNGPGSVEFSDYHPSRYELGILAKHWLDVRLSTLTFCWFYAYSGSTEIRILPYSERRLVRIAAILGDETYKRLVGEVKDKYRQRCGDEAWEAFQRNDTVWRDRDLDRFYKMDKKQEATSAGGANADPASEQVAEPVIDF